MNTENTTGPLPTDNDTEGHGFRRGGVQDAGQLDSNEPRLMRGGRLADADTEGHGRRTPHTETAEGDTEGHGRRPPDTETEESDAEGHGLRRP